MLRLFTTVLFVTAGSESNRREIFFFTKPYCTYECAPVDANDPTL